MIALSGVRLEYSDFTLGPIDLALDGSVIGVVGPNGAGKSTFLSIIAGVYEQHDGTVSFGTEPPLSPLDRRRMVSAGGLSDAWFGELDLAAHFRLFAATCPGWDDRWAEQLASQLRIPLHKPMRKLSTGTRAKAALVAAFARRPRVAIFDEPWSALDPIARLEFSEELVRAVHDVQAPITVLISSHDLDLVDSVADRLLMLDHGRCRYFGTRAGALVRAGLGERAPSSELYRRLITA
jgi:ABC-2 type transport system ATP-binding protein